MTPTPTSTPTFRDGIEAAIDRFDDCWSREPGEGLDEEPGPPLYRAMRDAHLSPETDAKVEG